MTATSPAEWVSAGCAGLSGISLIGLAMAFVDADAAYFDPRPWLARAGDRLLVEAVNVRSFLRDAALSVAALLALLTISETTR